VTILRTWSLQAATLTGTATVFFLLTSLRTFFQIEGAAKTLWGTTVHPRPFLKRVGFALTVTVLGPVTVASSPRSCSRREPPSPSSASSASSRQWGSSSSSTAFCRARACDGDPP